MIVINGKEMELPNQIPSTNFLSDGEPHIFNKPRKKQLQHIVIHETTGVSARRCKDTLQKKGLGIHLILARDGKLSCHADLVSEVCYHGNQLNPTSIGIEVVNPYYPHIGKVVSYPVEIIPAKWWTHTIKGKSKGYVLPTPEQIQTLKTIIPWLCEKLNIPYAFPTWFLNKTQKRIKGWFLKKKPDPGVVAHRDYASHSDGRWLLERLILDTAFKHYDD
jgi:N-acetyl-anhydromuramyl-L-alanine amidase AmpD